MGSRRGDLGCADGYTAVGSTPREVRSSYRFKVGWTKNGEGSSADAARRRRGEHSIGPKDIITSYGKVIRTARRRRRMTRFRRRVRPRHRAGLRRPGSPPLGCFGRHTKVNRCLTEGRAAFIARIEGIQSGAECERLAPQLSALADGEATATDMAALRPHLRSCMACRATLREFRAAPRRVAALVPAAALAGGPDAGAGWLESLLGWASDRSAALAVKAQGAVEIASAQKFAALAASSAVLAGGGVATVKTLEPGTSAQPSRERAAQRAAAAGTARASAPVSVPPAAARPSGQRRAEPPPTADVRRDRPRPAAGEERKPSPAPEAAEFDPTGNPTGPAPAPPPTRQPAPTPQAPPASGGGTDPQPSTAEAEFGL